MVACEVVWEGALLLSVLRVLLRLRPLTVVAIAAGFNAGDGGRYRCVHARTHTSMCARVDIRVRNSG